MSIDRCEQCSVVIDTDYDVTCYSDEDMKCICQKCRELQAANGETP